MEFWPEFVFPSSYQLLIAIHIIKYHIIDEGNTLSRICLSLALIWTLLYQGKPVYYWSIFGSNFFNVINNVHFFAKLTIVLEGIEYIHHLAQLQLPVTTLWGYYVLWLFQGSFFKMLIELHQKYKLGTYQNKSIFFNLPQDKNIIYIRFHYLLILLPV